MPATAGGSTSGSSQSVRIAARPGNRRVAITHAAGVPKSNTNMLAAALVLIVTQIASRTSGRPSSDGRSLSGAWTNSATSGTARNTTTMPRANADPARRIIPSAAARSRSA
jgi:hypothetical protein